MENQLYCGASKSLITPPQELLPDLYGLAKAKFAEINDELYVRAIAFSNGIDRALIVSFDLDKAPYPEENISLISEKTGIPKDNILFFGIHTHTAPIIGFRPFEPAFETAKENPRIQSATKKFERLVMDSMFKTIDEAITDMQPAKMGYGVGTSHINVNRVQNYFIIDENGEESRDCCIGANGNGPADHTLFVMKVEDMQGNPIAFFINYAVHCVAMFLNNRGDGKSVISGDIAGQVSQYMEGKYKSSVAVWSSGAAGDVNSIMMTQTFLPDAKTGRPVMKFFKNLDSSITIMNALAARHFADIVQVVNTIETTSNETIICGTVGWSSTPGCDDVLKKTADEECGEPYKIRLHLVKIGDVAFVGVNGELFSSLGQKIKEVSPMKNTVIINHESSLMLGNAGYIYDDETIRRCQAAKGGSLPGANFRGLPGYISDSLQKVTIDMFDNILLKNIS